MIKDLEFVEEIIVLQHWSANVSTNTLVVQYRSEHVKKNIGVTDLVTANVEQHLVLQQNQTQQPPSSRQATDSGADVHLLAWRDDEEPLQTRFCIFSMLLAAIQ